MIFLPLFMQKFRFLLLLLGASFLWGCTTMTDMGHSEPTPYDYQADAKSDVEVVLNRIQVSRKKAIIVMGANWCHDSRALAAHFEKPRFEQLIKAHYDLVYVDVGEKDRNLDIARSFGLDTIEGTPTIFIISSDGKILNLDTAPTWRNASSRTEDEVFTYFQDFSLGHY